MTRIDKVLSDLGIASRKEIRQIIRSGRVSVDGIPVTAPESRIDPETARLTLDGRDLAYQKFRYFAMDKPEGVITASEDGKQKTVMDLLPAELKKHKEVLSGAYKGVYVKNKKAADKYLDTHQPDYIFKKYND